MKNNNKVISTPDMGIIKISKVTGGNSDLYGSSVPNHTKINIEISNCEDEIGSDGRVFRHPTKSIVSVELSPMQYADLITTLNQGLGTPCTIIRNNDIPIQREVKLDDVNALYHLEIDKLIDSNFNNGDALLEEVKRISQKTSLSKADKQSLLKLATKRTDSFKNHAHFVIDQIHEIITNKEYEAKKSLEYSIDTYIDFSKNQSINVQKYNELKNSVGKTFGNGDVEKRIISKN